MENIDPFVFVLLFAAVAGAIIFAGVMISSRRFDRKYPHLTPPRD